MFEGKKRIIFAVTGSAWGGAQRYTFDLTTSLDPARFDPAVVCGGDGPLIGRLREAGIRVIPVATMRRSINPFAEIRTFIRLVSLFISENPDIIHLSSSKAGGIGAAAGRLAALFLRKRILIIFTAHGWAFHEDRPFFQKALIAAASAISTFFHDRVIVISARDWRSARFFVPRRKLAFIPNGISTPQFFLRLQARAELSLHIGADLRANAILVGCIAELTSNKGLPYLVRAFHALPAEFSGKPVFLIIIGEGQNRALVERAIRETGERGRIFLAGFIPNASRFLPAFDCFVLPSLKEGLPYAILEAMAAGLPIAATRVGGIPDLIQDRKTGIIVPSKNTHALAEAIGELVQNPERAFRLGQRARETVNAQYSLEHMIEETARLYAARTRE